LASDRSLTLVMLIAGEPQQEFIRTVESLQAQTSPHWSLLMVVEQEWQTALTALIAVSGLRRSSQRTRVVVTDHPGPPGALFDRAVRALDGSDIALIFPGDVWAPQAVARLSGALVPGGVAYADEDVSGPDGGYLAPRLKPAYSPEFLLHSFYTGRPMALHADVVTRLPADTTVSDPQFEHDLALRACEVAVHVAHVSEVLCHRMPAATRAATPVTDGRHVAAALHRQGEQAEILPAASSPTFRVLRSLPHPPLVSIIIPFRDEPRFLRTCIESVVATAGAQPIEFVLVDNGSTQPETATLLERLAQRADTQILTDRRPFNWAALNNVAAAQAAGDVLLFLNNDIEAQSPGWLEALCAQAMRPDVAVVGARLLYPDHRLQHCGVVLGLGGAAGHLFVGLDRRATGYLDMATTTRECAAVTGACFATRRDVFTNLEGFDESLGVDLNDVDYCLRAQRTGLRVLFEPEAELIHYESPSRGTAGDVRDIVRFLQRWEDSITSGDPFLNPELTRVDSSCALRDPGEGEWWRQWRSNLSGPDD
jgi:GT2 family glycosyltransferase